MKKAGTVDMEKSVKLDFTSSGFYYVNILNNKNISI